MPTSSWAGGKRRTFFVQWPAGYVHQVVLRNTAPRVWRTSDGDMFMHLGHAQLGEKGRRYRVEKWSAPHTDRTFTSLQSALGAWVRATKSSAVEEKKTPAQLDADISEVLAKEPQ